MLLETPRQRMPEIPTESQLLTLELGPTISASLYKIEPARMIQYFVQHRTSPEWTPGA